MVVGEEARGWWFDYCNHQKKDIEYLQGYANAYFDRQIHGPLDKENKYYKEYKDCKSWEGCPARAGGLTLGCKNPFEEKNDSSKFWKYIKGIREKKYSVCWNNLDKIHRIEHVVTNGELSRQTQALPREDEDRLHGILIDGKTLLRQEIEIVRPEAVIFIKYIHSTAKALGIDEKELKKCLKKLDKGEVIADISELCKEKENDTLILFLINHPNCRKKGFLEEAISQTKTLIGKRIKNQA